MSFSGQDEISEPVDPNQHSTTSQYMSNAKRHSTESVLQSGHVGNTSDHKFVGAVQLKARF